MHVYQVTVSRPEKPDYRCLVAAPNMVRAIAKAKAAATKNAYSWMPSPSSIVATDLGSLLSASGPVKV